MHSASSSPRCLTRRQKVCDASATGTDQAYKSLALGDVIDDDLQKFCEQRIGNTSEALTSRQAALKVYAWVSYYTCLSVLRLMHYLQCLRGLILRSESRAYEGVARLVSLFSDNDLSSDAARTMAILSKEDDGVLTKSNNAVIRVGVLTIFRRQTKVLTPLHSSFINSASSASSFQNL